MFPCLYFDDNYGAAITGLDDPKGLTYLLSIELNNMYEPNIRDEEKAINMKAVIEITNLKPLASYTVYRYDSDPG